MTKQFDSDIHLFITQYLTKGENEIIRWYLLIMRENEKVIYFYLFIINIYKRRSEGNEIIYWYLLTKLWNNNEKTIYLYLFIIHI